MDKESCRRRGEEERSERWSLSVFLSFCRNREKQCCSIGILCHIQKYSCIQNSVVKWSIWIIYILSISKHCSTLRATIINNLKNIYPYKFYLSQLVYVSGTIKTYFLPYFKLTWLIYIIITAPYTYYIDFRSIESTAE